MSPGAAEYEALASAVSDLAVAQNALEDFDREQGPVDFDYIERREVLGRAVRAAWGAIFVALQPSVREALRAAQPAAWTAAETPALDPDELAF